MDGVKIESYELNEKLYHAITDDKIDYAAIEELLIAGADPLGEMSEYHDTPLGELFMEAGSPHIHKLGFTGYLPKTIRLFIDHGFDCARIEPGDEDGDSRCGELWGFVFSSSKGACETMKIMIEKTACRSLQ